MTTIFERVEAALATLIPAVPFALAPFRGTLPSLYIVHQLIDAPTESYADNNPSGFIYRVQITIWSKNGLNDLPDVDTAMNAADFQIKNKGFQLPQDPVSGHWGLAKEYVYLEVSL